MGWPFGKKVGNRKHSKIDSLPPEMKATVEEMILDGSATYSEIVDYLQEHGYSLSVSSVYLLLAQCRYHTKELLRYNRQSLVPGGGKVEWKQRASKNPLCIRVWAP